tara:strand:+ start:545 stop:673 length:129 start_codon:yes stop_codon:yes gene_type:complete
VREERGVKKEQQADEKRAHKSALIALDEFFYFDGILMEFDGF